MVPAVSFSVEAIEEKPRGRGLKTQEDPGQRDVAAANFGGP